VIDRRPLCLVCGKHDHGGRQREKDAWEGEGGRWRSGDGDYLQKQWKHCCEWVIDVCVYVW
jgi:hypothetical protein